MKWAWKSFKEKVLVKLNCFRLKNVFWPSNFWNSILSTIFAVDRKILWVFLNNFSRFRQNRVFYLKTIYFILWSRQYLGIYSCKKLSFCSVIQINTCWSFLGLCPVYGHYLLSFFFLCILQIWPHSWFRERSISNFLA